MQETEAGKQVRQDPYELDSWPPRSDLCKGHAGLSRSGLFRTTNPQFISTNSYYQLAHASRKVSLQPTPVMWCSTEESASRIARFEIWNLIFISAT